MRTNMRVMRGGERPLRDEPAASPGQPKRQSSAERIRTLTRELVRAQDVERARIARELHDDISQQLALLEDDILKLVIELPEAAVQLADPIVQRARMITKSVHELSHRLHPARLQLLGLVPALKGFAAEMSEGSGIAITVHDDAVPPTLPPALRVCVFRVVQEAVHNACKYSTASHVRVNARANATHLKVTVEDDGVGFDVTAPRRGGLGLTSMAERVDAIGGSFGIESVPGSNTRVSFVVPLPATAIAV
jgi:signal transduction histidine kinase